MQINPYLQFNGNCAEAFRFYERALNGRIGFTLTYGESPMAAQMPPETHGRIAHTRLMADQAVLMGSDVPPEQFQKMQGCQVSLSVPSPQEAERIFAVLSENADIKMPIQETFWAQRFAMLVDQFGIAWMLNCEKPHGAT